MILVKKQQKIRLITVEQPTAWLIVAVLVETQGQETAIVSEPRVVKIIPKKLKYRALPGSQTSSHYSILSLTSAELLFKNSLSTVVSPYIPTYGYNNSEFIIWFSAIPPTSISFV